MSSKQKAVSQSRKNAQKSKEIAKGKRKNPDIKEVVKKEYKKFKGGR